MVQAAILTYNGLIFKLSTTLEKIIESYPEETKIEIRWTLVKTWFAKLLKSHRQLTYEFSKLSQGDRDELLKQALSSVLYKSVMLNTVASNIPEIGTSRRYIETVTP